MTSEALKKQKAASDKAYFLKMAAHHEAEATRYRDQAANVEPLELAELPKPPSFAGL
jgi:hypothetical protein